MSPVLAITEASVVAIATLIAGLITGVINAVMIYLMAKLKLEQDKMLRSQDQLSKDVEVVKHATNSLTDRLVQSTEKEALVRGGVEERARADDRDTAKVLKEITVDNPLPVQVVDVPDDQPKR